VCTNSSPFSNVSPSSSHSYGLHRVERFKTSLQFITVPYKLFYAALDACKVADYVLFILSSVVEVDNWGDTLLRTLQAQGLPSVVSVMAQNPDLEPKSRSKTQKSLLSFIQYFVPNQTKVLDLHSSSDRFQVIRALSEGRPAVVRSREGRTWMLAENFTCTDDGKLEVTGIIRGAPLSVDRPLHLPNFGDFQISKASFCYEKMQTPSLRR
jgi:pre-rRNA-processing protein TSR1